MKRPQPDFGEIARAKYLENLGFINKFIRLWGTTTVAGQEVLVEKKYFYKNMDASTKELAKWLKIYKNLTEQKMKGIKSAWLYLNPAKDGVMDIDSVLLAENLDKASADGTIIDVYLGPKSSRLSRDNPGLVPPNITSPVTDQTGLIAEIKNKFAGYYYGGYYCDTSTADRYRSVLAKYALITNEVSYEVIRVSKIKDYISVPYEDWVRDTEGSLYSSVIYRNVPVDEYKITVKLHPTSLTHDSAIVTRILADVAKPVNSILVDSNIKRLRQEMGSVTSDSEGSTKWSSPEYSNALSYNGLSSVWVTRGGSYYLKTSFLRDNNIPAEERVAYLMSLLDVDYKKKSRSAWERLVSVVIVVAAFVLAVPSGGASLGAVALAKVVLTAMFYITIATYVMSSMGFDGIAMSLGEFLKASAPLVTIATVVAFIGALYEAGKKQLLEQGMRAAEVGVTEAVLEGVKSSFSNLFESSFTDITFEQVMKNLNFVFNAYAEQDSKDLQKKIKREEAKIAEYEEAMEQSRTNNIWIDGMKSMYNPLVRDYSFYDSIYDKPYEWWATQYHTGCMQANGVSAFWTTDTKRDIM